MTDAELYETLPDDLRQYWCTDSVADFVVNVPKELRTKLKPYLWDYLSKGKEACTQLEYRETPEQAV